MTPYYQDDFATIYHGDALDLIGSVAPPVAQDDAESHFALAFADPPYNYGFDYGDGFDDSKPADAYEAWCGEWFAMLRDRAERVLLTPGHGNQAQWIARRPSGVACWYKPGNPGGGGIFQFCEWEPVYVWGRRIGGSDVYRATTNPGFKGDVGHPCPKPELLLRRIIAATKATSLLDPFVGSGTSLVAAKAFAIPSVGIERNERYCELAARRLSQEVLDFGGGVA